MEISEKISIKKVATARSIIFSQWVLQPRYCDYYTLSNGESQAKISNHEKIDKKDERKMILTPENVLQELEKKYNEHKGAFNEDFAINLSFYMDFAISRKNIEFIKAVHDKLISLLMKNSDMYKDFLHRQFGKP